MEASYIHLYETGRLAEIEAALRERMARCDLCPHRCLADRTAGKTGKCRSGMLPVVSSSHAHFGEESCLVGKRGSGAIFMTHCNLFCIFCQNYDISHLGHGDETTYDEFAGMMLVLQSRECHNINIVTPTHMVYAVIRALLIAVPKGLCVPLVYNSGGYDSADTLRRIEGVFDIYMPDFKYMDADTAKRLSGADDYPLRAMEALREMHRQVGDLEIDGRGIAHRGLLVRHLVLPNNLSATDRVIAFLASLSENTYLNLMDQYRPEYRARECADLRRRATIAEFDEAVEWARRAGLSRLDKWR
ncbi:MAG TPA: radical SAM protein [Spirochaetota bacterium]|nr:radical SAM protein [Spirochaetota bacterium]